MWSILRYFGEHFFSLLQRHYMLIKVAYGTEASDAVYLLDNRLSSCLCCPSFLCSFPPSLPLLLPASLSLSHFSSLFPPPVFFPSSPSLCLPSLPLLLSLCCPSSHGLSVRPPPLSPSRLPSLPFSVPNYFPSSLPTSFCTSPAVPPYTTVHVPSVMGFAHVAGFAAAWRCLWFVLCYFYFFHYSVSFLLVLYGILSWLVVSFWSHVNTVHCILLCRILIAVMRSAMSWSQLWKSNAITGSIDMDM